jgi:hypothetical protein
MLQRGFLNVEIFLTRQVKVFELFKIESLDRDHVETNRDPKLR